MQGLGASIVNFLASAIPSIVGLFSKKPVPREPAPPPDNFDAIDKGVDAELARRKAAEKGR